jgi:hypothetical protein
VRKSQAKRETRQRERKKGGRECVRVEEEMIALHNSSLLLILYAWNGSYAKIGSWKQE